MPTETPRSPALLALVRDADRVRTEALAALLPRLQPQIVPAAAPSEAVEAVAAAQAALVMVFEQPDGQGHLDLCRAVRERFPLVATVLVRERSDRMPPRHPAIDDAVGLDHPDEMAARLDILLDVHRYNSRAPAVREGLADELRALDLSLRLLDEGRLLPPSRVAYAALVDADRLCELEAALAALGDAAVACYARAPEPTVIFSSSDQPIPGAWPCVREAMLRGTRQEAEAPDGRRLVAFPVSLSFRTVVYPLLGVCAALPGRGELAAAQRDAFLRVEQTVAEALSRQVSQRYGIAYDLLVSAVDRSEHVRAQRRRARQLLRANERLREINRLKNEFLANVSHELKTPMTSVIGFASLLLRGTAGELNEKARHFIQRILANARTLHGAITDVLDFAQLTARGGEPIITAFELRPLVEASMAQARPLLADKPVELVADLARDLPTLSTDQDRLRQVLLHLLSNAAKFTHRGEIRVSARIEEAEPSNVLVLAVSDTGVGMPADALPHIFEEFRQVDGSSTRSHGGAGLGLALVMHQCRLLHGEVAVESQPEEGSTFTVRLPVDLAACQERRAELRQEVERGEPDPADRSTPIALVVTDEPQLVLDLRRWLEPRGYRVAAVFDRDQALSRAWAILPCAVVLDVMVPGSEVWELADVLGADPRTTDIPLVVISSLGGREIAEAVGASDWLPRPPAPEALLNALERLRTTGAAAILAIVGDAQRRDWARRSLREAGYQVTTCAACSDACHFAGSHFDLILLDPEAEGEGVLTALGSVRTGFLADTPVVAWVPPDYPDPERERLASDVCALVEQQLDDPADLLDAVAAALADT